MIVKTDCVIASAAQGMGLKWSTANWTLIQKPRIQIRLKRTIKSLDQIDCRLRCAYRKAVPQSPNASNVDANQRVGLFDSIVR